MKTCPKCGRTYYRGTVRKVEPTECSLEDGTGCHAYRHGLEVGKATTVRRLRELRDLRALDFADFVIDEINAARPNR